MIGLARIGAVLAPLFANMEPRHWLGLGASVALHLGVLLGWQPEPPAEPKPISFEITLEPTRATVLPEAKTKRVAKKAASQKLAKQRKAKALKVARIEAAKKVMAKREPHVLDTTWRSETKASQEVPALALPDARALGLQTGGIPAANLEAANASAKPQPGRAEREKRSAEAATAAAANDSSAGLSEPGVERASTDSMPRGETGLALANATSLVAGQGINPGTGGAGAQASTAAASLAGATGGVRSSEAGLHASASPQAALSAPIGTGMQAATATATAAAASAGAEVQGVRLTASGALTRVADMPAGNGSIAAGPQAGASAQMAYPHAMTNQAAGGVAGWPTNGGMLTNSQASSVSGPINAGIRSGAAPAGFAEAGMSRSGRGQEATGRLGVAAVAPTALMGSARVASAPGRAGQGGEAAALAPGEPGSSPRLAVTLQPVLVGIPAPNPYLTTRPGQAGAGASGETSAGASRAAPRAAADAAMTGGASLQFAATATGAGPGSASGSAPGVSRSAGGKIATPGQAAAAAVVNAAREAGRAPVVLQAAHEVPVKVVRPDTEIQRLDVLAPSNYCPLPLPGHTQPDNRAPQPDRNIAEQPAYALDNPRIDYPFLANIRGVEGRVTVRVEVLANGRPGKMWLKQSSGSGILDQDAQAQLMRWRFVPARKYGQPVSAWIDVPVLYRLSEARP